MGTLNGTCDCKIQHIDGGWRFMINEYSLSSLTPAWEDYENGVRELPPERRCSDRPAPLSRCSQYKYLGIQLNLSGLGCRKLISIYGYKVP
jgi:hypothetical protein